MGNLDMATVAKVLGVCWPIFLAIASWYIKDLRMTAQTAASEIDALQLLFEKRAGEVDLAIEKVKGKVAEDVSNFQTALLKAYVTKEDFVRFEDSLNRQIQNLYDLVRKQSQ